MSPTLNLRRLIVCVLICSLYVTGLVTLTTGQSHASNSSLPRSSALSVKEPSEETAPQTKAVDEAARARVSEASLSFEENRGQADHHVKYISRGSGYTLFLTPTETVLALRSSAGKDAAASADASPPNAPARPHRARTGILRMKLSGASPTPTVAGESEMGAGPSSPVGDDAQERQTNVARYERVKYAQVYPGVDMSYSGRQQQLEYDFEVAPGVDARRITFEFDSLNRVKVESGTGDLVLETGGVKVRQHKPVAYQEVGGERREIASWYVARSKNRVRIEVGEYDRARPLMIRPVLSYPTNPGGSSRDAETTLSSDSQMPDQSRQDQPVTKPTNAGSDSIGGSVVDRKGHGIEGVLMALDGPEFSITYTDQDGSYSFEKLEKGGDYTVYPFAGNYIFNTEEHSFHDLRSNQRANFNALSGYLSISGYVSSSDGYVGFRSVPMNLDGSSYDYTSTDYDGFYSFDGLEEGGDYTVSPGAYSFSPESQSFYYLQQSEDAGFTALPVTIYGRVGTAEGTGVGGVTLTLTGGYGFETYITATTDSDGYYLITDVPNGPPFDYYYEIKASKPYYTFDPWAISLFYPNEDQYDQDFIAIPRPFGIVGVVRLGAARVPGVTVKLTSPTPAGFAPQTTTTNSAGAYAFDYLPAGRNYIVTPMKPGYQLTPVSKSVNNLSANQMGVDFTVKNYSVTGRITRPGTTTGIDAVTVTLASPMLAGFSARSVRTDSTGAYTFTSLPAGNNYTIKVVKSRFTFTPATRSITNLRSNIPAGAATNFTGTGP